MNTSYKLILFVTGTIVTQKHLLPVGGYFDKVSSPHMFFEVMIYVALYLIVHNNSSWLFVLCWVLTNQIENAWLTHKWYLATFPDYPVERRAIFPMCLWRNTPDFRLDRQCYHSHMRSYVKVYLSFYCLKIYSKTRMLVLNFSSS